MVFEMAEFSELFCENAFVKRYMQKILPQYLLQNNKILFPHILTFMYILHLSITAHPNVKLFITHGGLHSLEETVYYAKPIVAVPFFADQFLNMKFVERKGYGKVVDFLKMTEESFVNSIKEVLSNPT
jgi:glucuronosyltransferase